MGLIVGGRQLIGEKNPKFKAYQGQARVKKKLILGNYRRIFDRWKCANE